MTTFHYIVTPLEKSFFLHPSNDVRMWGIKNVFDSADAIAEENGAFDEIKVYDSTENFLGVSYSSEKWVERDGENDTTKENVGNRPT